MRKNYDDKVNRKAFVQLCIENPKEGANYLHNIANQIEQSKKTSVVIGCLKKVLFLADTTLYRDLGLY